MKRAMVALAALLLLASALPSAAAPVGIPILIDLSHGQPSSGIEIMMRVVPEAQWYILVKSEEDKEALPPLVKSLAHDIIVGDFSTIDLEKYRIQMVIVGQPQALFTPEEVSAIVAWFTKYPGRAIWLAAVSDYPAQGSETAQQAVNMVLEALGAKIRMDYVSIEDEESCAIKTYRVLGIVNPDPEVAVLGYACDKVLFHGPGGIAWVDEAGKWHVLTREDKAASGGIALKILSHWAQTDFESAGIMTLESGTSHFSPFYISPNTFQALMYIQFFEFTDLL